MRAGSKARGYCDEVRKINPQFTDAYLALGVYEYAAGSLPLPVKLFSAIGGVHGSKKRGIEYVSRVAQGGNYERDAARVLLTILYRRERRPLEAARVMEGLAADYPRNYLFELELASMYADANQNERAVAVLKSLLQKADQNDPHYRGMPREAVVKKMQVLQARLSDRRRTAS